MPFLLVKLIILTILFTSTAPPGTPFKTIIIGMGEKSILDELTIAYEFLLQRNVDIVKWAKENGVSIIGIHIDKKENSSAINYNMTIFETIIPYCDLVITCLSSPFSEEVIEKAEKSNIPLIVVDKTYDLVPLFKDIFEMTSL